MNNEVKRTIMAIDAHADDIEINLDAPILGRYYNGTYTEFPIISPPFL